MRRDLAIADAMREQRPDLEIQWLTQSPVAEFLERRGEVVHPASRLLANESGHFESESGEHDLHAFQAVRRMDEVLVNNFMVFDDLVEREPFDLWLGDEAWDLDHFLHEHPELKRAPFVWMTDFVGWVPMPDGGEREAFLTSDYNAEMVEHVARYPHLRDRSVFVGDPADVVDLPLGPDLPTARAWTEAHFDFAGYVMGERPDPADSEPSCATGSGTATTRSSASSASAGRAWAATCCGGSWRRTTRRAAASPACGWSSSPDPASTPTRWTCRAVWRCTASCPTSTCTTRPATWPSSKAG